MNEQSANQAEEPYVFVTYDGADATKVQEEIEWLQSDGVSFWSKESVAGEEVKSEELADALENAVKVLFFVSSASMDSDDCRREVAFASLRGLEVLQVFLEEGGLTQEIRDSHHLGRVYQVDGSAAHRSELSRALKEPVTRE
jgi:hypothetical protein|tara:strand:+ start:1311 stop:1736 length:426 start_codon:yes stop_codon:yes gene_type:complete